MKQKSGPDKAPTEQVMIDIRRQTRRQYSAEEKIRLRWALRNIKAKRTKLTRASPSDLKTLLEIGLVEIRDDAPVLTNEGHQGLDR